MRRLIVAALALITFTSFGHAKDTLTIYTYDGFTSDWGTGPKVKAAFEKQCDCTVDFVALPDGVALLNRLKLEGAATKADIVLGIDTNLTAEAEATGLFAPHEVTFSGLTVPGGWSDKSFLPFDWGYFAVVFDSEKLKPDQFQSLKEFVEKPGPEKIVIEDPRTATPGLGLLLWIKAVYGDQAEDAWEKLKPRVLTVTPGWSEAYGLFTKGEAPMVLSYTTSPAYHMIAESTKRYQAFAFAEGHYMQIEVAGMTKSARNKELARRFLAFMISPGFQDLVPETNWMYPAGPTSKPLPAAFDTLVKPAKSLIFSSEEVARNRKAWTEEWLAATSR
jgi:thiamine transport system substrate-binding protein